VIDSSFYGVSADKENRDKDGEDAFSGKTLTVTEIHGENFTLRNSIIQPTLSNCSLGGILPALLVNGDCSTGHGRLSFRLGIFYRIYSVHEDTANKDRERLMERQEQIIVELGELRRAMEKRI
jgi:hypothetical protein